MSPLMKVAVPGGNAASSEKRNPFACPPQPTAGAVPIPVES